MYQGFIFDFNGVLLWDSPQHEQVWKDFSKQIRGTALTDEEIALHVHGRTNPAILQYLMKDTLTPAEIARLSHDKEAMYREICLANLENFRLSPGAIELLDAVVRQNIPHTIATASEKEFETISHVFCPSSAKKIGYDDAHTFLSQRLVR